MGECITVREFDKIICNSEEHYGYVNISNKEDFDNLINFVMEFKQEKDSADSLDFLSITYRRDVGKCILVKNYVGLIELKSGLKIEVLPKVTIDDGEEDKTKSVFLKMLRSLKEFNFKAFNSANVDTFRFNIYEIFINMYLKEITALVKQGIKRGYVQIEENVNFLKGKLIVKNQIRKNFIHKERFYVSYSDFNTNIPENKIIKSTLKKLQIISTSYENKRTINMLLSIFDSIDCSLNHNFDFSKINKSNNEIYETLMAWSKIFLLNKSFTTFSGNTTARALLFPMEKVFESYVGQRLKKELSSSDISVFLQDQRYYIFDNPKKFSQKPDVVVIKGNNNPIVLDTKWKKLDNSENFGISRNDIYQMYAYSKKYKAPVVWLLYPWYKECPSEKNSYISYSAYKDDNLTLNFYFIDLLNIDYSLTILTKILKV